MRLFRCKLCAFLYFWATVTSREIRTPGPCDVNVGEASINCSNRELTEVPTQIWNNTIILDLSQNHLNLTDPKNLRALGRFRHLLLLNLSGNYLPVLEKDTLAGFSQLLVLDLSGCQLTDIKPGALQGFPRLKRLLLGNNRVQDNSQQRVPSSWLEGVRSVLASRNISEGVFFRIQPLCFSKCTNNIYIVWVLPANAKSLFLSGPMDEGLMERIQRKLLTEGHISSYNGSLNVSSTGPSAESQQTSGWPYLVAAMGTIVAISVFIILLVKCKLFQQYLASYQHALLSEMDTASHCDRASLDVGVSGQGMASRGSGPGLPSELDDDDGFIEDNYIQASERERAEREAIEVEDEFEDDDIQFSIS
uniref:Si:ch73-185c24.2 n=1 Tax=Paramormyrops kingsleyae TaxID=1676925 RepID=A0A3B3RLJ6_9TELE